MARPRKIGLDYFPFDTDFFSDEKIVCIAGEFGLKGEMTAIRLLCAIYRGNGYFVRWDEPLLYKLSKEMGVSAGLIENVVTRLAKWGFFDKILLDSEKILTSRAIQRRYFEAVKLRKTDYSKLERKYLLDPEIINSMEMGVNSKKTGVNSYINPTNKIKLNNNPPNPPRGEPEGEKGHPGLSKEEVLERIISLRRKPYEEFLMKHRCTDAEFRECCLDSMLDWEMEGWTPCLPENDMKIHSFSRLLNYTKKKLEILRERRQNESKQQDRLSRRRIAEVHSTDGSDYHEESF